MLARYLVEKAVRPASRYGTAARVTDHMLVVMAGNRRERQGRWKKSYSTAEVVLEKRLCFVSEVCNR